MTSVLLNCVLPVSYTHLDVYKRQVIGPLATPPESKAIAVKIGGVKKVSTAAMRYPGINKYMIGIPTTIRIIARATEIATPIDKLVPVSYTHLVFFCPR